MPGSSCLVSLLSRLFGSSSSIDFKSVSGLSDEFCLGTSASFDTLSSPDKLAAVNYSDIKYKLNEVCHFIILQTEMFMLSVYYFMFF